MVPAALRGGALGKKRRVRGECEDCEDPISAHWRREAGPGKRYPEIERAYRVRGGRVPFLTMPLRAAAASVTPLDGPVEVVADSESQDSRREGVELAAEGSALRRWAARRACDLEDFYPLKNFANANLLLHFSSVEICVSVLRLIQRNFGAAAFKCFSGE